MVAWPSQIHKVAQHNDNGDSDVLIVKTECTRKGILYASHNSYFLYSDTETSLLYHSANVDLNPIRESYLDISITQKEQYGSRVVYPIDQSIISHALSQSIVPIRQDKESGKPSRTACMARNPHHELEHIYTTSILFSQNNGVILEIIYIILPTMLCLPLVYDGRAITWFWFGNLDMG